jgi:uncharacterized protein YkwD
VSSVAWTDAPTPVPSHAVSDARAVKWGTPSAGASSVPREAPSVTWTSVAPSPHVAGSVDGAKKATWGAPASKPVPATPAPAPPSAGPVTWTAAPAVATGTSTPNVAAATSAGAKSVAWNSAPRASKPVVTSSSTAPTATSTAGLSPDWAAFVAHHNALRARHGAPPLVWDASCAASAAACAAECSATNVMRHCHLKGADGTAHGQNIYWHSAAATGAMSVQAWYDEMIRPGYTFGATDGSAGTGHFTQVVWMGSTRIGGAVSSCGRYLVANYAPVGNIRGRYRENVLPPTG